MSGIALLRDLAVVMIVAGAVTILFHRLRQPVILGYIVAGLVIGPNTLLVPLVRDAANIETLSTLGIVFLLFSVGLEFSLRKLRQVGPVAGTAAFLCAMLMIWVGFGAGRLFGWSKLDSLFLGALLCVSSSTIIAKTFQSLGKMNEPFAQAALAITLVEDIVAVTVIATLSSIVMTGSLAWAEVVDTLWRIGVFIIAVVLFGILVVPRLVTYVGRFQDDEVLVVTALGLCFGLALLAVKLGYSAALGAFIMGAIVSESPAQGRLRALIAPVRDIFVAVFFVAVGMMIQPEMVVEHAGAAVAVALLAVVGRSLIAAFVSFTTGGLDGRTALRVGLGLTPLGEFSFLIVQLGVLSGKVSAFLFPVAVAAAALTSLSAPYLVRSSDSLVTALERWLPKPLTTFLQLYSRWVGSLRAPGRGQNLWRFVRRPVLHIVVETAVITAVFLCAAFAAGWVRQKFPERMLFEAEVEVVTWLAVSLLCVPGFVTLWRNFEAIALILTEAALPLRRTPRLAQFNVQRLLRNIFLLVGAVLMGLWLTALSSTFLPPWPLLLVLALVAFLIVRRQWHAMVLLHSRLESAVREVFTELPEAQAAQRNEIVSLIKDKYPWDFELAELTLPRDAAVAGKTIRELRLRSHTGASIVGIEREGFQIANPSPGVPLLPGDGLLLIGQKDQLEQARAILSARAERPPAAPGRPFAAIEFEAVPVAEGSALDGKSIAESSLRQRSGATIIGIQRGDQRLTNPDGDTRVEAGDVLLLLGNRSQLDTARQLCAAARTEGAGSS